MDDFFEKLLLCVEENNLSGSQIFNMDETGFQIVGQTAKVVVKKGE